MQAEGPCILVSVIISQETQVTKLELNCGNLCCAHETQDIGIINCFSKLEINHRGWKSGRSIEGREHAVG